MILQPLLFALPLALASAHDPVAHGHAAHGHPAHGGGHTHPGHGHGDAAHRVLEEGHALEVRPAPGGTTGSGALRFRHRPLALPAEMAQHLEGAHGGFATAREDEGGDGSTWFSLRGVGLLRLSPTLDEIEVVGGDEAIRNVNLHNTAFFRADGESYLALPSNEAQKVYIATTRGEIVRVFHNPYGPEGDPFRVCDVELLGGKLYAANGYADNVCFRADPFSQMSANPRFGVWDELRFGGTGAEHGRFGTAHGITRVPGLEALTIADRANARLETYTGEGSFVGGVALEPGTMPCDVDYRGSLAVVGCLKGPGGQTPAPVYLMREGNVVSELAVERDLGLDGFTHVHNASLRGTRGADGAERLFVLVYAWNPGNFAILEQVLEDD